jgi:CrcB protein
VTALAAAHLVGVGGALGAVLRHLVVEAVDADRLPFGTFTVNVVGSFALALVTVAGRGDEVALFVGTGACGAFTTFSSFSVETVRLWETGRRVRALGYASGTFVAAALAVVLASLA